MSTWSEQVLDRVITAHFDALPQFSDSKEHALNLFQTLSCLLQKRKDQYKSEYSMSREEVCLRSVVMLHDAGLLTSSGCSWIMCCTLLKSCRETA